jgi:hypothetical protein
VFSLIITSISLALVAALILANIDIRGWYASVAALHRGKNRGPAPRGKAFWYLR